MLQGRLWLAGSQLVGLILWIRPDEQLSRASLGGSIFAKHHERILMIKLDAPLRFALKHVIDSYTDVHVVDSYRDVTRRNDVNRLPGETKCFKNVSG